MVKQAVIYCRFSPRPDADECDSNLGQEARCRAYCKLRGYYVVDCLPEFAVTGGKLRRPQLDIAMKLLQPGMVLIVDRNDRLARDMLVALTIHHEVEQLGCTIEFADGSPLRNTPEGKLFSNLLSAFAQFERERFALRTKDGMARKKAEGVWCGRPPIGWRKTKGSEKLTADKYEQKAISMAQRMHHLGFSSETIAIDVQGECGLCRGKPWSARTIRRILARKPAVA